MSEPEKNEESKRQRGLDKTFLIIGLGTFGEQTARDLHEKGARVLAVDRRKDVIDNIQNFVTSAVCLEATDVEALRETGAFECDVAVVSLRRHFDASVLVTHALRHEGIDEIYVHVDTDMEASAIKAIGATGAIFPERDTAQRMTNRLLYPDLKDHIPLSEDVSMIDLPCPEKFVGQSLIDLHVRKRFGVYVIGIRHPDPDEKDKDVIEIAPKPDEPLSKGDVLIVVGKVGALAKFKDFAGVE